MRKSILQVSFFLASWSLAGLLSGCASSPQSSVDSRLNEKIAKEIDVKSNTALRSESNELIRFAPDLSEDQRRKLLELKANSSAKANQLSLESLRLRAALVKNLLADDGDPRDSKLIDAIKNKLKQTEHERLSLFFSTVRGMNVTMGRWESRNERENQEFLDQMMLQTMDYHSY